MQKLCSHEFLQFVFLMLPLSSLDKIKVFSQDLLVGRTRKAAADGQDSKKQRKARDLRGSVSREHCTAARTSFI